MGWSSSAEMALRRLMSHVLLAKSNYYKSCQPGIWTQFLNRTESTRTFAMATKYVAVEKGTPNSTNYRVFLSKFYIQSHAFRWAFVGIFIAFRSTSSVPCNLEYCTLVYCQFYYAIVWLHWVNTVSNGMMEFSERTNSYQIVNSSSTRYIVACAHSS